MDRIRKTASLLLLSFILSDSVFSSGLEDHLKFFNNYHLSSIYATFKEKPVTNDETNSFIRIFLWSSIGDSYCCKLTSRGSNTVSCIQIKSQKSTKTYNSVATNDPQNSLCRWFCLGNEVPSHGLPESCGFPYILLIERRWNDSFAFYYYDTPRSRTEERGIKQLVDLTFECFKTSGINSNALMDVYHILY